MAQLHLTLVALALAACGHESRVAECDDVLALVDKLATCQAIPAESRDKITHAKTQLEALFEGATDGAIRDSMRKTCRSQRESIAQAYAQFVPDCLK